MAGCGSTDSAHDTLFADTGGYTGTSDGHRSLLVSLT